MRSARKITIALYLLFDWLAAMLAWAGLFFYRKVYVEEIDPNIGYAELLDNQFYYGILAVPIFWLVVYFITGTYSDVYRKSRFEELSKTFLTSIFGVIFLFFLLLLDDLTQNNYKNYYKITGVLFGLHFGLTILFRLIILNIAKSRLESGKVGYQTLIIGSGQRAVDLYEEISGNRKSLGYQFIGYVEINGGQDAPLGKHLTKLGHIDTVEGLFDQHEIDEVVIAIQSEDRHQVNRILHHLGDRKIVIKIVPGMYEILAGSVKMTHVTGALLIEIYPELMALWQRLIKRALDITASFLALSILSPLLAFVALRVRLSSDGPIFYRQERVGLYGKPFTIYKFRSMFIDAEAKGPALSKDNDPRITPWGRVIRKWRFDELPQFYNVLIGDMSLVGPRPERRHFIDQIVEQAPAYKHLQKARPGITSWGMVKFGYAENVEQMIQRMKYDLLYIENMSLGVDFKIMIYTVLTIINGEGK